MSPVQRLRQHLPNLLTLCNLALGFLSVVMAFENRLVLASWLILLAALFDFLDGFTAKLLGAVSELGKQLDSLADIISFGMAPAAITYRLMEFALRNEFAFSGPGGASLMERIYLFSPMLLVLFAAVRLARFNLRENRAGFLGLATPASGILVAGLAMVVMAHPESSFATFLLRPFVLLVMVLIISILMIMRIPMFSLKFKGFGWRGNKIRYFFLAVSLILLIILHEMALPVIILVYLLLSIVSLLSKTNT
jgi:CDP-diacylglycerol--serine O-phosphatidyltransferase